MTAAAALTLSNLLQPRSFNYSIHQNHKFTKLHPNSIHFPYKLRNKTKLTYISLRPTKSFASINGYSVQTNTTEEDGSSNELEDTGAEKIRKWIDFLRSILPGGSWWGFSDEVEIQLMAKPVTVRRALTRMWDLISHDRLLIFAAFAALIVTAVCSSFLFQKTLLLFYLYI